MFMLRLDKPLPAGFYKFDVTANPVGFQIANPQECIKRVIFNDPATIVIWSDDSKTVVKCENEAYDPEKGLAMCVAKRAMGNKGNYYSIFKKFLPKKEEDEMDANAIPAKDYALNTTEVMNNFKKAVLDTLDRIKKQ